MQVRNAVVSSKVRWCKSSYSLERTNCVEVAFDGPVIGVRDSKNPAGGVLAFPAGHFATFLHVLASGR